MKKNDQRGKKTGAPNREHDQQATAEMLKRGLRNVFIGTEAIQLLDQGANPDASNEFGDPVFLAEAWGLDAVKAFIRNGVNIRAVTATGWQILHVLGNRDGSQMSHAELEAIARCALDAGADYEARNNTGNTPLHTTATKRHGLWNMLVDAGADMAARNGFGAQAWQLRLDAAWSTAETSEWLGKILRHIDPNSMTVVIRRGNETDKMPEGEVPAWATARGETEARIFAEHPATELDEQWLPSIMDPIARDFYGQILMNRAMRKEVRETVTGARDAGAATENDSNATSKKRAAIRGMDGNGKTATRGRDPWNR